MSATPDTRPPDPLHDTSLSSVGVRRAWIPWAISAGVHALMVVAAFLLVWTVAPASPPRPQVVVSFENPGVAPVSPAPASTTSLPSGAGSLPTTPALGRDAAQDATSASAPGAAAAPRPSEALAALVDAGSRSLADPLAGASSEAVQERRVPDVRFAGLGASNAVDVVYVIDASGSMIATFPVVLDFLERSVSRLSRTQRFQFVFFGPEEYVAAPHPGDVQEGVRSTRLIRATPDNVASALAWARDVLPSGRSNPVRALQTALSLRPQAIFVLSNTITGLGAWEVDKDALLKQINALNPVRADGRRDTVIKAVQFLEEDPAGVLRALAEAHGGPDGYKFISREEARAR